MTSAISIAASVTAAAIKAFRDDQKRRYSLVERHVTRIHAEGIGCFNFENDVYSIVSPTPDDTIITAEPFDASTGYWDGPSMTWDMSIFAKDKVRMDGLFEASLDHDLTFEFAEAIAKANNVSVDAVYLWANRVLQLEMKHYAKVSIKAERVGIRAILDYGAGIYSRLRKKFGHLVLAIAASLVTASCVGCASYLYDEDGEVEADPIIWKFEGDCR